MQKIYYENYKNFNMTFKGKSNIVLRSFKKHKLFIIIIRLILIF
jgi:hypothetical protein